MTQYKTTAPDRRYRSTPWPLGPDVKQIELQEGDTVEGRAMRLPAAGQAMGNSVVLATEAGMLAIPATSKKGWTVLERALSNVAVGDQISITFVGWRESKGGHLYRLVTVGRALERAA